MSRRQASKENIEQLWRELRTASEKLDTQKQAEVDVASAIQKLRELGVDPLKQFRGSPPIQPTKADIALEAFRETRKAVLRKVEVGEDDIDQEYKEMQEAAINLIAHRTRPMRRNPIPTKEHYRQLAFRARVWRRAKPMASAIPTSLLERAPWPNYEHRVVSRFEDIRIPIREGIEPQGTFEGPFIGPAQYINGDKPLPGDLESWFAVEDRSNYLNKSWYSDYLYVTGEPFPPLIVGWLWFYVDIEVPEAGRFSLRTRSQADLYGEWGMNFLMDKELSLLHIHEVLVKRTTDVPPRLISSSGESRIAGLLERVDDTGYTMWRRNENGWVNVEATIWEWSPYHDPDYPAFYGARTLIDCRFPFEGPRTLRIMERIDYLLRVDAPGAYAFFEGLNGTLAPLHWGIYKTF